MPSKVALLLLAIACTVSQVLGYGSFARPMKGAGPAMVKPAALRAGQTVGFISPASTPTGTPENFQLHVKQSMALLELAPKFAPHSFTHWGYFSATDQDRASDVMAMFSNSSVAGIISNRGGWGCNRILDLLDYSVIAKNPKIIMGYSDLTGLINAIHLKTGLVTFHGPMGLDNWNNENKLYTQQVLMNKQQIVYRVQDGYKIITFKGGKAQGRLLGGNLSVFTAMVGSQYLPDPSSLQNTILFLEEVEEAPYRVDRMMTQLALSGFLTHVQAVVWGRCTSCDTSSKAQADPTTFTTVEVLRQHLGKLNIPSFFGAEFGHISSNYVLPIGGLVEIDADAGTITMLESVVV